MADKQALLSDDQMLEAVTLFAQGKSRIEVAAHFIDTDPEIEKQERENPKALRKRLSNALRLADPSCTAFAITKYGDTYRQHKVAMEQALLNQYDMVVQKYITNMTAEIQRLEEQREELDHLIQSAIEINPTGTGEYLSVLNAKVATDKRIQEIQEKVLDRIEKVTGIGEN